MINLRKQIYLINNNIISILNLWGDSNITAVVFLNWFGKYNNYLLLYSFSWGKRSNHWTSRLWYVKELLFIFSWSYFTLMFMAPDNKINEVIQKLFWNEVSTSMFTPIPRFLKLNNINIQRYTENFILIQIFFFLLSLHNFYVPKLGKGLRIQRYYLIPALKGLTNLQDTDK